MRFGSLFDRASRQIRRATRRAERRRTERESAASARLPGFQSLEERLALAVNWDLNPIQAATNSLSSTQYSLDIVIDDAATGGNVGGQGYGSGQTAYLRNATNYLLLDDNPGFQSGQILSSGSATMWQNAPSGARYDFGTMSQIFVSSGGRQQANMDGRGNSSGTTSITGTTTANSPTIQFAAGVDVGSLFVPGMALGGNVGGLFTGTATVQNVDPVLRTVTVDRRANFGSSTAGNLSAFTSTILPIVQTTAGSRVVTVSSSVNMANVASGNPFGVGSLVIGPGIPAGAVIQSIDTVNYTLTLSQAATTTRALSQVKGDTTAGSSTISFATDPAVNLRVGMAVSGGGFTNATITAIDSVLNTVTVNVNPVNTAANPIGPGSVITYFAPISLPNAVTVNNSQVVTVGSTVGLTVGAPVSGTGIQATSFIQSINTTTNQITLSLPATQSSAGVTLEAITSSAVQAVQPLTRSTIGSTGTYRYYLPYANPHKILGTFSFSGRSFDYGAYGIPARTAPTGSAFVRELAITNVQGDWTGYVTPACVAFGGGLNTAALFMDQYGNSYLEFRFYSSATGNAPLDVFGTARAQTRGYNYTSLGSIPQSFTISAGQDLTSRLVVDFSVRGSTATIGSPLSTPATYSTTGDTRFYPDQYDELSFNTTTINVQQATKVASGGVHVGHALIGGKLYGRLDSPLYGRLQATVAAPQGDSLTVSQFNVDAPLWAPYYAIGIDGTPGNRGAFTITSKGSILGSTGGAAGTIDLWANYADLRFLGQVNANQQNYFLRADGSAEQYEFTTYDPANGNAFGTITGQTVTITGSQPKGGTVKLNTAFNTFRFDSGTAGGVPYAYDYTINDAGDLVVDAVASSSGTISLTATGNLTINGSAVRSMGDISLRSVTGTLAVAGIISTGNGQVTLDAPSLTLGSSLYTGGNRGVTLVSQTGGVTSTSIVQAGGGVKQTVRLASDKPYTLANLLVGQAFDGMALVAGDRILLTRQAAASENGIYVVQAAGAPVRANDAKNSPQFTQGFIVPVLAGTQQGLWTFRNDAVPVLGTSPLLFVPTSATRVYENVVAATTGAIAALSGPAAVAVDGTAGPGVAIVAVASTDGLQVGMAVSGGTIPAGATITAIDTVNSTITLSQADPAALAATPLTCTLPLDGVALAAGDRVLVKNQVNPALNGIYVYDPANPWSRASDADTSAELLAGGYVYVSSGVVNGTKSFALANDVSQVGITPMTFSSFGPLPAPSTRTNFWMPAKVVIDAAVSTTTNIAQLSGLQTIDGVTVADGTRVLVKHQNKAEENGVWVARAGGKWDRAGDADALSGLPRGTTVYVTGGTQYAGTTWQFDDSSRMRATVTAQSSLVTGMVSTSGLEAGMLVAGPGISSGTTIQQVLPDGTSIRLNTNALQSGTVALTFMRTSTVVVANKVGDVGDPIPFIPVGGSLDVTAATTIGGTGRLQGSTGLLTAGVVTNTAASTINALTNVGRLSAAAPGPITVNNSSSLEVQSARSTLDGAISITASGTLSALAVSSVTAGPARPIALTSTFGDVVAEKVTTQLGDITVTSANGGIAFTKARFSTANISAVNGSVIATADSAGAVITVDGRLLAQGAGSDVVLSSNNGQVSFTGNAVVTAADQIKINTPNSTPTVGTGAAITAARLSLTAQFAPLVKSYTGVTTTGSTTVTNLSSTAGLTVGMAVYGSGIPAGTTVTAINAGAATATLSAPAAATTTIGSPAALTFDGLLPPLGNYQTVDLNRTDSGSLVYTSASSLTVEGATTANGPIVITAPDVIVPKTGDILSQGTGTDVTLTAAAGNLTIDGTVTAVRDVIVQAPAGEIGGSATQTLTGTLTSGGVGVTLASTAALAVGMRVSGNGIPTPTYVVSIDSATQITLSQASTATGAHPLTFTSPTGLLTAQRNVSLSAASAARVSLNAPTLASAALSSANAFLGVSDSSALAISSVTLSSGGTAAFGIGSAALGGGATVGSIDASATGTVVLSAYGNILGATPDTTADVKARTVTLVSTTGKIVLDTDTDFLSATAQQKNQSIAINDVGASGVELTSVGSGSGTSGVDVGVTAVGPITATKVLTAGKVSLKTTAAGADILVNSITATGNVVDLQARGSIKESPIDAGADITATTVQLTATDGSIGDPAAPLYLAASGVTATATTNGQTVTLKNDTALAIGPSDVRTLTLAVGGVVTQTGIIKADTLTVNAFGGSNVALDTQNNQIGTFSATSVGAGGVRGNVALKDVTGSLMLDPVVGATVTIDTSSAAGALTQAIGAGIDATSLVITGNGQAITLVPTPASAASGTLASGSKVVTNVSTSSLKPGMVVSGPGIAAGTTIASVDSATQLTLSANAVAPFGTQTLTFTPVNKIGTFKAANGAGNIALAESDLGLVLDTITGGTVTIDTSKAAGGIGQAAGAAINASTLDVTGNGGGIILTNAGNKVGTLRAVNVAGVNGPGDIALTESDSGLILDTIVGGKVTVNTAAPANGTIVQATGAGIVATTLDVTGNGQAILITPTAAVTPNATLVKNSATVQLANTANLRAGNLAAGAGIPAGTTIASVDSPTQVTLSAAVLNGGTNVPVTFTPVNKIGTFKAANGTGPISLTESDLGLVLDTITGGTVTIDTSAGNGTIMQASGAAITAATLDITGNGGAITLTALPVNATGDIVSGQPSVRNVSGGTAGLRAGMAVTGAGIPAGATIASVDSGTQVTLSANAQASVNGTPLVFTPLNKVGTFRGVNSPGPNNPGALAAGDISLVESDQDLTLDTIIGGIVTINTAAGNGPVTQVAGKTITAAMLDITGNGATTNAAITITNAGNVVGGFRAANATGNVSLTTAPVAGLVLGSVTGGTVTIDASTGTGKITQSAGAAITATTLDVRGTGQDIDLGNTGSTVGSFTATNLVGATRGGVRFLSTGGPLTVNQVTGGFIDITAQGTLTAAQPITAGTAAQDPYPTGDITLRSLTGNVVINAPLSAKLDTVTLDASKGVILQNLPGGTIDAGTVIWYATVPFGPQVVGGTFVLGPNLTAPGPLPLIYPSGTNITLAGASTLDGPVTIAADSVKITRLVRAGVVPGGFVQPSVSITANNGNITFTDQGRVVADGGNVTLSATAVGGKVIADNTATWTTVSAGASDPTAGLFTLAVDTSGQANTALKTAVNFIDATAATAGSQLVFSQTGAVQLGKLATVATGPGGSIALTATGAVTQATAISTGTLSVTTTAGGITLTNPANDVSTLSATAAGQAVSYTDVSGFQVNGIAGAPVTLVAGGAITQGASASSAITGGGALTVWAGGPVTLTNAANDAATVAIAAGTNAVSYSDTNAFQVAGITGASVTLGAGGAITQAAGPSSAIAGIAGGGALTVTAGGAVTLTNTANDAGTVAINAGTSAVSYTDADFFQVAGIAGAPITLVAGGAITQGVGNAAAITGGGTLTINAGGNVTLGNVANDAGVLTANVGTNSISYTDVSNLQVSGITAAAATLTTGGAVTQGATGGDKIAATALSVTAGGDVTLTNSANEVTNLTLSAAGKNVAYTDATSFVVNGLAGASIVLSGAGITQGAAPLDAIVSTGGLTVTSSAGGVILDNTANDVATLTVTAKNQAIKYVDQTGFQVGGLDGASIDLAAGGPLTQGAGAIKATGQLTVSNNGGAVTLTNAANDVATLAVNAAGQPVSYVDASALAVAGIRGTAISLKAASITQSLTAGNEIVGNTLSVDTGVGALSLANPLNNVSSLQVLSAGAAAYTDLTGFVVNGVSAASVALVAGGTVTQGGLAADKITVPGLFDLTNSAGSVTLDNPANDFGTLKIDAGTQNITVVDATAVVASTLKGAAITLTSGGAVTQAAGTAITGTALAVTAGGVVTLTNTGNDVQSLAVNAGTNAVGYVDATGFTVAGIIGGAIALTGNGPISQTGAITGTSLTLTDKVGPIVLDHPANAVGKLSVAAAGQAFTYVDSAALSITKLDAGAITLTSGGALSQTGPITGTSLSVTNTAGGVSLIDAGNDVTSLAVNAAGLPVAYSDKGSFTVNGIAGAAITLQAAGPITQAGGPTAAITGTSLTVKNSAGVVLDNPANAAGTLQITAIGQPVTYTDSSALILTGTGVTGSVVALSSGGALTQAPGAAITATASLSVTNTGGGVTLLDPNNRTPVLSVSANGQAVEYQDKLGFQVNGVQAASIKLYAGAAITQGTGAANAIAGGIPLYVKSTAGAVTLDNAANDVSNVTILGTAAVTFVDSTGFRVDGITGTALSLASVGPITQAAGTADAIIGTTLSITNTAGPTTLANPANDVGTFSIVGTGQSVTYQDSSDLVLGGVSGSSAAITVAGKLTQAAGTKLAVTGLLTVTAGTGDLTLTNAGNDVGGLSVFAPGRVVSYSDVGGFTVNGITAATVSLSAFYAVTQGAQATDAILATALAVKSTAGGVVLGNAANDVSTLSIQAVGQTVTYTDATGFTVVNPGIAGSAITLTALGGGIDQSATLGNGSNIVGGTLVVKATGTVSLPYIGNDVRFVTITAPGQTVYYNQFNSYEVNGIQGTAVTLEGVTITQSAGPAAAILASSLFVDPNGGSFALNNPANNVSSLRIDVVNSGSYVDVDGFTLNGIVSASSITLTSLGGAIVQAPLPADALSVVDLTVNAAGGAVTLDNALNNVNNLRVQATGQPVTYRDIDTFTVRGIQGSTITLIGGAGSGINQGGTAADAINGSTLVVRAGAATLTNPLNDVASLAMATSIAPSSYTDVSGFLVNGITASSLTLVAGGAITQGATAADSIVVPNFLTVTSTGSVTLDNPLNDGFYISIRAPGQAVTYVDATNIMVDGIAGDPISLQANGPVDQLVGPTSAVTGGKLTVTTSAGGVDLRNAANNVTALAVNAPNQLVDFVNAGGFTVRGLTGSTITLSGGGAIGQGNKLADAIIGNVLKVTNTTAAVVLGNTANDITTLIVNAPGQTVTYADASDLTIGGITGGAITLSAAGLLDQTAAITGTSLDITNTGGDVLLGNTLINNKAGTLRIIATGKVVNYRDSATTGFVVKGIDGKAITLAAAGPVTQGAAAGDEIIGGGTLAVSAPSAGVTLGNALNDAASVSITAGTQGVTYADKDGFTVNGITTGVGGPITLSGNGAITQGGTAADAVAGTSLTVTNPTGAVVLDNAANDVATLKITTTGQAVTYADKGGFAVDGLAGSAIKLTAAGAVTQLAATSAAITGKGSLTVVNTGGSVKLDNAANDVSSLSATAVSPTGVASAVTFVNAGGFRVNGITAAAATAAAVTLSAGGTITQGSTAADAILGSTLTVTTTGGGALLGNPANDVSSLSVNAGKNAVTFADANGFLVGGITGGAITLTASTASPGTITQSLLSGNQIQGISLTVKNTAGSVTLTNAANEVASLTVDAAGQAVSYTDATGFTVNGLTAASLQLVAAGTIDQGPLATDAITATSLAITNSAGGVILANPANDVTKLGVKAVGQAVTYVDKNDLEVTGIDAGTPPGGAITLTVAGPLTQSGGIVGGALSVTDPTGPVTLTSTANAVSSLSIAAKGQPVAFTNSTGLTVAGIQGSTIALVAKGTVTQAAGAGAAIVGTTLSIDNTAGPTTLANPANNVGNLTVAAGGQDVTFTDVDGLSINGVTAATMNLTANGLLVQGKAPADKITAGKLVVTNPGGPIGLDNAANNVSSLAINAGLTPTSFDVTYVDADNFIVDGITGRDISLAAGGAVTQNSGPTARIAGRSLVVTNSGGPVVLDNPLNDVAKLAVTAKGQNVTFTDSSGLVVDGITGAAVKLTTGGALTQTKAIRGASLSITGGGTVTLQDAANDVDSLSVSAAGQSVAYRDATGFTVNGLIGTQFNLDAGGKIAQGSTAADRIQSGWLIVTNTSGGVVLDNSANDVFGLAIAAPGQDVSYSDVSDFTVYGITAAGITLQAGAGISQDAAPWSAVTGTSLAVTAGGTVKLDNPANAVDSLAVSAPGQSVTYIDVDGVTLGGITAGVLSLIANGPVAQTGTVVAGVLAIVNGKGGVSLPGKNNVDSLRIIAAGQPVAYNDVTGFNVVGIQGSTVSLTAAGVITQDAADYSGILATTLTVSDTAGSVTLDNAFNDVASLSIQAAGRPVTYVDATGFTVNGISGSDVILRAPGAIGQGTLATDAINASTLTVTGKTGAVTLNNAANAVNTIGISAAGQPVTYASKTGFTVGGGLRGSAITLSANGAIAQGNAAGAAIVGGSLAITNTAGGVTLTNAGNDVQSLAIANGTRAISYTDATGFTVAGITGGSVTLAAAGMIDQAGAASAAITASALTVNDTAGAVYLTNPANDAGTVTFNSAGQVVAYTDATGFTIGGLKASSAYLIAGGAVTQGPLAANAIAASYVSVTASAGDIILRNPVNDLQYLAASNPGRGVSYVDATGFVVTGITGGTIDLTAAGDVYQGTDAGSAIKGSSLSVTNTAGVVSLVNTANDVSSLTVANGTRTVAYTDASGVALGSIRGGAIYLTVGGPLTQTAALVGSSLQVTGGTGAVTLDNAGNDVDWLSISNAGRAVTYADKNGFNIFGNGPVGLAGSAIKLSAGGDVQQFAAITGGSLAVTNTAGAVTLTSAANDVSSVAIANPGRPVSYTDANGYDVAGISGGTITLSAAGNVTQSAAVTGGTLVFTGTGGTAATFAAAGNDVGSLVVNAAGQTFTYADAGGFTVNGIRAASAVLTAAGAIVQGGAATDAITAVNLAITNTAGGVVLGNAANDVGTLSVSAGGQSVSYTDANDLTVGGIGAATIVLTAGKGITQTGPIIGGSLTVTAAGDVSLGNTSNDLTSLAIANGTNAVTYTDANAVALGAVTAGAVTLSVGGDLTQTAALKATAVVVEASAGAVVLGDAGNTLSSVKVTNPGRAVTLVNAAPLSLAGITAGSAAVTATGNITQSAAVVADAVTLTSSTGSITLDSATNAIGQLAASVPTAKLGLTVQNTGALAITQVDVAGTVKIGTTGDLRIGPAGTPSPLLKAGTAVNLAGVTGQVILQNGGRIVAPAGSVTLPTGQSLQIAVSSASTLSSAITQANTLKVPTTVFAPGGTLITLSAALPTITSPIAFVGSGATIAGSAAVPLGFALTSTAAGCSFTGFTFQGFATAAIRLTGVPNVRIDGVTIAGCGIGIDASGNLAGSRVVNSTFTNNGTGVRLANATNLVFGAIGAGNQLTGPSTGTGLLVSGTTAGTTARANSFSGYGTGISLNAATGILVGGTGAGEANTVSSAARAGVFATGICTGSTVSKTQFFNTPTPYSVGGARGLTVIR